MINILLYSAFAMLCTLYVVLIAIFIGRELIRYSKPKTKSFFIVSESNSGLRSVRHVNVLDFEISGSDRKCFDYALSELRKLDESMVIIEFRKL